MDTRVDARLALSDLNELFRPPEVDPFGSRVETQSGIDRLLYSLRARRRPRQQLRVQIALPASSLSPDLESRCRGALRGYCGQRIGQLEAQSSALWREGWATLGRGLLFLAACMIGSRLVGDPKYLPAFLARFVDEGFIIAGWVALWYPLDVLLYQHWPVNRDRHLYAAIMDMQMEFAAAPARREPGSVIEDSHGAV